MLCVIVRVPHGSPRNGFHSLTHSLCEFHLHKACLENVSVEECQLEMYPVIEKASD